MKTQDTDNILHNGEWEAQRRFCGGRTAENDAQLAAMVQMIQDHIRPSWIGFLESQPFFFLATANQYGACDCSFRGREYSIAGKPTPLLKVLTPKILVFPDYSGNNLYNSLGNILVNPHVGMLFVDFQKRSRARVNGSAEIVEDKNTYSQIWPRALRYVRVTVEQAYPNCKARIP
ncbi:MAG TPA: pyridoxamine 5'-phosphate oxidase family protein, partial [Acidiferrobacter sp.]|nr:pyridoxamine 5'-phosphate oxidase family protein [Acidiferrobacter sp.]